MEANTESREPSSVVASAVFKTDNLNRKMYIFFTTDEVLCILISILIWVLFSIMLLFVWQIIVIFYYFRGAIKILASV